MTLQLFSSFCSLRSQFLTNRKVRNSWAMLRNVNSQVWSHICSILINVERNNPRWTAWVKRAMAQVPWEYHTQLLCNHHYRERAGCFTFYNTIPKTHDVSFCKSNCCGLQLVCSRLAPEINRPLTERSWFPGKWNPPSELCLYNQHVSCVQRATKST